MRSRRPLTIALFALLALSLLSGSAAAAEQRTGGQIVVEEGETVRGDLNAFGGDVLVAGTVEGDLQAYAGNVRITGSVDGDAEVYAGALSLEGDVGGGLQAFGGSVDLREGSSVGGSVEIGAGAASVAGSVGGDLRAGAEELVLRPSASVAGEVVHSARRIEVMEGASVAGGVTMVDNVPMSGSRHTAPLPDWVFPVYTFAASMVLGVLLLVAFPAFSDESSDRITAEPLRSAGMGLLVGIGGPVVLALAAATLIGLPLALAGFGLYLLAVWAGYVFANYAVGRVLMEDYAEVENRWIHLFFGLLLVELVGEVPVAGGVLTLVLLLLGLGAMSDGVRERMAGRKGSG